MSDAELNLLETIYSTQETNAALSQRELAGKAGLSLGMTNVLLRRFVERGWVKLSHLSRRSLGYILTPQGLDEILRRSLAYFSRAAKSASLYRGRIETFVGALPARNFSTLVLEGPAELDFLFEYSCERHSLEFVKNPKPKRRSLLASQNSAMFVFSHILDDDASSATGSASPAMGSASPAMGATYSANAPTSPANAPSSSANTPTSSAVEPPLHSVTLAQIIFPKPPTRPS